jgi:hypothetical protein
VKLRVVVASIATTLAILVGTTSGAYAAPQSDVQSNIERLAKSSDQTSTWASFTDSERRDIKKEFNEGTFVVTRKSAAPVQQQASVAGGVVAYAYSGCWSLAAEVDYMGGLTRTPMFGIWQRTTVCVSNGSVTSASVTSANSQVFGNFFITVSSPSTFTYNAGYEGRGVASAVGVFGAVINGNPIGASKTVCSKIQLNANGYNYRLSSECWV